jgi:AhpD family alkylhydroperoxidase
MKSMPMLWRRLVKRGETCTRCGDTGAELEAAVATLTIALQPLGITPVLETQAIDDAAFQSDPSESNRVWIAGKSLEDWLGASVGTSRCRSVCGDSDCRTLEIDGRSYETVPREQFIKAGLMAATQMLAPARTEATEQVKALIALGAAIGASCEPCLQFHYDKARKLGISNETLREAPRIARKVKEASAKNISGLADRLLGAPDAVAAGKSCCGASAEAGGA